MSVPLQVPIVTYTANGTTNKFPITFDLHDDAYLIVTVNKERPPVGAYEVVGEDVVFRTVPNNGDEVTLARDTVRDRETNFTSYDNSFRPEVLNYDLDKIWHFLQEQNLIDATALAQIKAEIEWRRTNDFNYDELAKVRELQIFDGLKKYVDTFIAATNPNIFGGVTAGVVFALDQKSVQTHLENIAEQLEQSREDIEDKATKSELATKADKAETEKLDREKADITYVDEKISANANNQAGAYSTIEEAMLHKDDWPENSSILITNDGDKSGLYRWDGVKLTPSEYDPFKLSKNYTDDLIKNTTTLLSGSNLSTLSEIGTYLLLRDNTYLNLPENLDQSESMVLKIEPATGAYVYQQVHKLSEPYRVWRKLLRISDGSGNWTEPFYEYQKLINSVDPISVSESGYYVLTDGLNLPSGLSGTALMQVERFGGFTIRTLIQSSNTRLQWQKVANGVWVEHTPFNLTVERFTRDYAYRGLKTSVDFNMLIDDGRYLVNGSPQNGPPWVTDTKYVDVKVYGSFLIQQVTSSQTINQIAQRRGNVSSSEITWQDWVKVGAGGDPNNTSSLSGKTLTFIGDSIVEGGNYPELIGEQYGATIHKFGFGGCRASHYPTNPDGYNLQCLWNIAKCINSGDYSSLISGAEYTRDNHSDNNVPQATAMSVLDWSKVDILCIAFGTNDWTSQNGLGSDLVADSEGKTYKGALCYAVEQIQSKYPHLQIVLIGMSFRLRLSSTPENNSDNTTNDLGEYLNQYQQALIDVGEKYHIPAFNMYRKSGLNSMNYQHYLQDAVHPKNGVGYKHWSSKIGSFLNSSI